MASLAEMDGTHVWIGQDPHRAKSKVRARCARLDEAAAVRVQRDQREVDVKLRDAGDLPKQIEVPGNGRGLGGDADAKARHPAHGLEHRPRHPEARLGWLVRIASGADGRFLSAVAHPRHLVEHLIKPHRVAPLSSGGRRKLTSHEVPPCPHNCSLAILPYGIISVTLKGIRGPEPRARWLVPNHDVLTILLIEALSGANSGIQFAGTSTGAPFFLTKNTRNFAGFVPLAFRPTMGTSSVPS